MKLPFIGAKNKDSRRVLKRRLFYIFRRKYIAGVNSETEQSAIIKRAEPEKGVLSVFLSEIKTQRHAGGIYHCFFR